MPAPATPFTEQLDQARLAAEIDHLGLPVLTISSAAEDQQSYLMRPDLGRRLAPDAEAALAPHAGEYDVVFVVTDGLSAGAVQVHAPPVLAELLPLLRAEQWRVAPLVIVRHGRVAVGDAVAAALHAHCVVVLIGERPGLSAPDSMGAYLTWAPGRAHHRRRPQLHLQYSPRRHQLCRRGLQNRPPVAGHARPARVRRAAQGRLRPAAARAGRHRPNRHRRRSGLLGQLGAGCNARGRRQRHDSRAPSGSARASCRR